jgi:hypothetical protein
MKKSKRNPFTLIEISICLFLIAIAGSLLGMKGYSLIERARFDAAVSKVKNNFKECRYMASLHGEDVIYILDKWGEGLRTLKGFEGATSKVEFFPNISLIFDGKEQSSFTIRFSSTGSIAPLGKLKLLSANGKYIQNIDMKEFFRWEEK